ncbi:MAG TPA: hypothetical protein V6D05_03780 [Stenomitos sp.]
MTRLHFGVDVDGVLAHHLPSMLDVVKDITGIALTPDQVTDYYFAGLVSREEMERVFEQCMECALELPPFHDYHLVNELPGDVTIVTHRHEDVAGAVTRAWLERHGIRYSDLIFTRGPKSLTGTFDFFVDDAPHNAVDMAQAGVTMFLMEQPYNKHMEFAEHGERIVRVSCWTDIKNYLDERSIWTPAPLAS